jgi:hypothetical protein
VIGERTPEEQKEYEKQRNPIGYLIDEIDKISKDIEEIKKYSKG